MMPRYFVTEPVPGGYAYFDVRDRSSKEMPNFSLVTIWKKFPNAREVALGLAEQLNLEPQ